MILVRYILVFLIIYLLIRSFVRYWTEEEPSSGSPGPEKKNKITNKKISKKIGEYIDYEELKKIK
jgi:hypothetical protein